MAGSNRAIQLGAAGGRAVVLALCWWAIVEGDSDALGIGVVAVIIAVFLSLRMHAPQHFRLLGFLRFLPLFLWQSLVGGIDIARRALTPTMPLQPSLMQYRTQLPAGLPRVFLANVISLLPGTLSADLHDDVLTLHILSEAAGGEQGLRHLERAVARVFG